MNTTLLRASLFFMAFSCAATENISFASTPLNENTQRMTLTVPLQPHQMLYKEFIDLSVDNPAITLGEWSVDQTATNFYDPSFKETKKVYKNTVTISVDATKKNVADQTPTYLHFVYYINTDQHPNEVTFPLSFETAQNIQAESSTQEQSNVTPQAHNKKQAKEIAPAQSWSAYLSNYIEKTNSLWIRLLLVFILGIMLSLTPCIYPMIPITIGILQAQGSTSFWYNFLLAVTYTCGLAMTFAVFGLLAGCVGPLCGQLLMHPAFMAALVALLVYFALSMLGLYEPYVPAFFKPKNSSVKTGSLLSVFVLGSVSGTIASPCVSPGLALLLSIVATMGNAFLGFILLFTFGVGLSMPLLIVGTFSSSLNMLPRAGQWMVEVKKIFGFMMLAMCFYYLNYIIPTTILLWLVAFFTLGVGLYYLRNAGTLAAGFWKKLSYLLGVMLCAGSIVLLYNAYQEMVNPQTCSVQHPHECWHTDYQDALETARAQNKKIFIDFWAKFCTVCIAINNSLLSDNQVLHALDEFVCIKVDGTFGTNKPYDILQKQFHITGFPVFMIIDPTTQTVIKKWGAELYDVSPEAFIALLEQYK